MLFLTYVKFIFSRSIEDSFKEIAIAASFEIEKSNFEKNGCILFGFYIITCKYLDEKLNDELKQQNVNLSDDDLDAVLCEINDLGFFSASKLLPEEHEYSHEKYKTEILNIFTKINEYNPYIIKYLNKITGEFIRDTGFYDANICEFFKNYFSFFNKLLKYNSFTIRTLYINYIIISKILLTDYRERNIVKDVIRDEYNGIPDTFYDTLESIYDIYADEKYIEVITLKNIKKKYQKIHQFIDNLEDFEAEK